jgi:secreted trypsin-like serine protease
MRGRRVRTACLLGALAALLCCAPASAPASASPSPRIIHGTPAAPGEYPAQGFLQLSTSSGNYVCGGSLVSNRYFLTAAHCATQPDTTTPLDPTAFHVTLGKVDKNDFTPSDRYSVVDNQVNAAFNYPSDGIPDDDVALLRLSTPAPPSLEPLRLIGAGETSLWAAGATATIIGWGTTEQGGLSDQLLQATVPMTSDASCSDAWGSEFLNATMVCAGGGDTDTCGGDSGGPLMVSDGAFLVLAGLTSWGANQCATAGLPGVYTRLGATALNDWVRERVPMARESVSNTAPETGQPVTFSVTTTHPGIPAFTNLAWDFDGDGATDAEGANPAHAYATAGRYVARVTASGAGPDTAVAEVAVQVSQPPIVATPTPVPTVTPPPPVAEPAPRADLAVILASGKPKVSRRGRFHVRIDFAADAPPGIAVIEVFRGKKKIGSARGRVRRAGSRQVSIKLTKAGKRLLKRSKSKRLKVRVQVRVKHVVLGSRTLTIRR